MKSYYHQHEIAYQQIQKKGFVGWGDKTSIQELGDPTTKKYLKNTIQNFFPKTNGFSALDLGCGTGTSAFQLADLGFDVTGFDISETAIHMAQQFSESQNLRVKFQVQDILNLENLDQKFDLIYDSHCLHCIVFEKDRSQVFTGVKSILNKNGYFVLDTMVTHSQMNIVGSSEVLRFDKDYILWHKVKDVDVYGVQIINNQPWCAQRRIYPQEIVITEIMNAGFKIVSEQLDLQNVGEPSMLRLVLQAKTAFFK
jgi:2-polyprenyl-3-methyl-5-hydroxy-6-metoxy-1,4-benzoquinol methylase